MEEFWLVLAVHSKCRPSHLQPKSATFSQKSQPKFNHFQPFSKLAENAWLKMAEFGCNGWKCLNFGWKCWKWLNLAENSFNPFSARVPENGWIWLNMVEFLAVQKGDEFGCEWCSWLQREQKNQPTPIKKKSNSQLNPFLAWWLYLSRG